MAGRLKREEGDLLRQSSAQGDWRTWSNGLTALRLVGAVPLAASIYLEAWTAACAIFWTAVATDLADGRIARARGEASPLGGAFDHTTDALFIALSLTSLAAAGELSWILPALVLAAFIQYFFDSKATSGQPLRTSSLGRWNGILYFVPVGIVVTREGLRLDFLSTVSVRLLAWVLVVSTVVSMADRAATLTNTRRR